MKLSETSKNRLCWSFEIFPPKPTADIGAVRGTTTFFTLADVQGTPTGIDNTVTVDMRVYPNPATNFVAIEGANVEEISAYSLGGALMGSTTEGRLDVSSYAPGLYILKVKADGKVATVKLNVVR